MKTKREALAEQGLAIAGARGKFSTAANAWLDEQRAKGVKFSDDNGPVKPTGPKSAPVEKKVVPGDSEYVTASDYRFPIDEYRAFYMEDGKRVYLASMKEVCDCRYSFCNHPCDEPAKYGKVVTIEKVKGVAA